MTAPDGLAAAIAAALPPAADHLDAAAVDALARYLRLLDRWNRAYNLTSVREPAAMVTRHVADSLVALPFVAGQRLLDVGSGAGLPGVPLAIALPACRVTLLDSQIKKARFLRQVVAELPLPNATVVHARVEDVKPEPPFDTVTCRAFASLGEFVAAAGRLCAPAGRLVALKGRDPADEVAALPAGWWATVTPVAVPGLDAERHIVVLERAVLERAVPAREGGA